MIKNTFLPFWHHSSSAFFFLELRQMTDTYYYFSVCVYNLSCNSTQFVMNLSICMLISVVFNCCSIKTHFDNFQAPVAWWTHGLSPTRYPLELRLLCIMLMKMTRMKNCASWLKMTPPMLLPRQLINYKLAVRTPYPTEPSARRFVPVPDQKIGTTHFRPK